MTEAGRYAMFISHANPEDGASMPWLGARLTAAGYQVWADMLRSRAGRDWQRRLEDSPRNKGFKVCWMLRIEVCAPTSSCHAGMQSEMSPIADNALTGPSFPNMIGGQLVVPQGPASQ